ncbi:hypothetical protein MASR2M32_12470 [Sphaerotilus sulfidivorans]
MSVARQVTEARASARPASRLRIVIIVMLPDPVRGWFADRDDPLAAGRIGGAGGTDAGVGPR